jgi:predicted ATPase
MSQAERAYLHEDVGNALEALFGEQADEVAVQLALHFEKAGLDEKTRYYLQKAGEQAAARYANDEAIAYFTRALELTPKKDAEKRFELLMLRGELNSVSGFRDKQLVDLDLASTLSLAIGDQKYRNRFLLKKAGYYEQVGKYQDALDLLNEAKLNTVAQIDPEQYANIHKGIGFIL